MDTHKKGHINDNKGRSFEPRERRRSYESLFVKS
jgi:hypothetical protein